MFRLMTMVWISILFLPDDGQARPRKLRVCVGDFPSYTIGLDYLLEHKDKYEVSQSTVYACSVRFKKKYFDLILADSFIFVTNYLDGDDTRIISLVNYSDGVDQIVGQKDHAKMNLRGSRWALQRGTVSTVLLNLYLKSRGLTLRDVVLEDVKVENTPQAIGRSRFYGAVNWQPYTRQSVARGAQVLATSADYQDKLYDFMVTRTSALVEHRALIQAYVEERLLRAKNKDRLYASYAASNKIPVDLATEELLGLFVYSSAAEIKQDQAKVLNSLHQAAEVADISQYSGQSVQTLLKKREGSIFDFSLLE